MRFKDKLSVIRRSKNLIAFTLLLAFVTHCTTLTLVQTLAPALVKAFDYDEFQPIMMQKNKTGDEPVKTTSLPNASMIYCKKSSPAICVNLANVTIANEESSANDIHDLHGAEIYCKKNTFPSVCVEHAKIMGEIAGLVGALSAVGPLTEIFVNPVVGIICSKVGHRSPFLAGSLLQIIGSIIFLLATNTAMLFVARIVCGIANTLCDISALVMACVVFSDVKERSKIIMFSFASSYPLAAVLSYLVGNVGYSFLGPWLPFGMLCCLSVLDGTLRCFIDAEFHEKNETGPDKDSNLNENQVKGTVQHDDGCLNGVPEGSRRVPGVVENGKISDPSVKTRDNTECFPNPESETSPILQEGPPEGTYWNYLQSPSIVSVLLLTFTVAFAVYVVLTTAPNWVTNVLHAEQQQLGIVLGVSSVAHLVGNLTTGILVTKDSMWMWMISGCFLVSLGLAVYPWVRNIWLTLIPEILTRVGYGIAFGMSSSLITMLAQKEYSGDTAKAMSLYVFSYCLGCMFGPFFGGILKIISLMTAYYISLSFLIVVVLGTLTTLYLKNRISGV